MLLAGDRIRSPAVAQQASVLVVEDDASLRLLARVNLELEHFRVREAGTLEEAHAAVAAERPALVFLDVHLHGESTDALLEELRAAGIPVVVVTGTADITQYRDRADQVLGKPFEPSALVAAARRYVG
jgi:two-component system nitrogen regulation response regulator NtrX